MKYYHVSTKRWDVEEVGTLRAPDPEFRGYGESETPRLSVAPTVCQCLYAAPDDEETFHIYEILVSDPIDPGEGHGIADLEYSGEKWVVQQHLDQAPGNKIGVRYVGRVRRTRDIHGYLKSFLDRRKLMVTSEEEDALWDKSGDEWEPLFPEGSSKMQRLIEEWRRSHAKAE